MLGSTPSFTNPPIVELVLGVEFTPIDALKSIHYQGIYDLFRDIFPISQDAQPLATSVENVEGDPHTQIAFQVDTNPTLPRLWCLSREKDLLIQFKQTVLFLTGESEVSRMCIPRLRSLPPSLSTSSLG